MSKGSSFKKLIAVLNEVKADTQSSPNSVSYHKLPESIINHRSNQNATRQSKNTSREGNFSSAYNGKASRQGTMGGQKNNGRALEGRANGDRNSVQRAVSPQGAKGVSFETATEERDFQRRDNSSSTDPLVTDSCSDTEEEEMAREQIHENVHVRVDKADVIQEQYGYNSRRLNRIKFRREHELEEFNFGINFALLKQSKEQQARLRLYLRKHQHDLNEYVEQGTGPIFGYPPICYTPPHELKKENTDKEFVNVLMRHVFQKPEHLASVKDIIEAKKSNEQMLSNFHNRFLKGGRRRDQYGNYIQMRSMRASYSGNVSPESRQDIKNIAITRKLEHGSSSPNKTTHEITSFEHSMKNTRGKRGKKANLSKEGRENIMTNIKISSDFNFEKRTSNERARSGSKASDSRPRPLQKRGSQPINKRTSKKNSTMALTEISPIHFGQNNQAAQPNLRSNSEIEPQQNRQTAQSQGLLSRVRMRHGRIFWNKKTTKQTILRDRTINFGSIKSTSKKPGTVASRSLSKDEGQVGPTSPIDLVSQEYGNFEHMRHVGQTESAVTSMGVQSLQGTMQRKSSVHSILTQSTKPASYVPNNFMPQVTSENYTIGGPADVNSTKQSHSTMLMNSSIQGRENKLNLRSALMKNNQNVGPMSLQMSISSGGAHTTPNQDVFANSVQPNGEILIQNPLNYQVIPLRQLHKSVSHQGVVSQSLQNFKPGPSITAMNQTQGQQQQPGPPNLIYTQEERNMKLQMQNFKVYQELRVKMEHSIQKQRKALKQSIHQYVATDEKNFSLRSSGMRRNSLMGRHLTERKSRRKIRRHPKDDTTIQVPGEMSLHNPQGLAGCIVTQNSLRKTLGPDLKSPANQSFQASHQVEGD